MHRLNRTSIKAGLAALLSATFIAGCGGGSGNASAPVAVTAPPAVPAPATATPPSVPLLPTSASLANICTPDGEKQFTQAYLSENYLWYSEIPVVDAALFSTIPAYFRSLLSTQRDATGQFKDRFSFIVENTDADALLSGESLGYGVHWEQDAQGRTRVAYVDSGSPAALAGMQRGGQLVSVSTPGGGNWSPNANATITFVYRPTPASDATTITLQSAPVLDDPVPLFHSLTTTVSGRRVGYLLFNGHTDGAQDKLIDAVNTAQAAAVQDLVLDMRYNGGGFIYTAQALSSMLTGPAVNGKVVEKLQYNDKRPAQTEASIYRFVDAVQVSEPRFAAGTLLPRLDLPRVYVLATGDTCSASETVINALRGVGVNVVIVGQTTCGKPYGFTRKDNCGFSYFPIEFKGVNEAGFGDYAQGFAATCPAADDFEHALGSSSERMLATALAHIETGQCPLQPQSAAAPGSGSLPFQLRLRGKVDRSQ